MEYMTTLQYILPWSTWQCTRLGLNAIYTKNKLVLPKHLIATSIALKRKSPQKCKKPLWWTVKFGKIIVDYNIKLQQIFAFLFHPLILINKTATTAKTYLKNKKMEEFYFSGF